MKHILLLLIATMALLLPACKDFTVYEDILGEESITVIEVESPQDATLNPSNPNEFIYRWTDESVGPGRRYELRKRNRISGEDYSLVKDVWYETSWSDNGWLAIGRADNQVWVMRDDGTKLERLTSPDNGGAFYPSISRDGRRIIFLDRDKGYNHIMLYDRETDSVKTLIGGLYSGFDPEFSPKSDRVAYIEDKYNKEENVVEAIEQLFVYDLNTGKTNLICEFPYGHFIFTGGINWLNEDKIMVATNEYVYLVDLQSKSYEAVFEQKKKVLVNAIQTYPQSNGEKIVLNVRRWRSKKLGKKMIEDRSIEIWRVDGMKREEVLVP